MSKENIPLTDEEVKKILEERMNNSNKDEENFFTKVFKMQKDAQSKAQEKLIMREQWSQSGYQNSFKDPSESPHYKTNQSNEKYVKYYDENMRDLTSGGAMKIPPHPRQRNRCDYHLEDFIQSVFDGKTPLFKTLKVYISCLRSKPGEEPPRLRKEIWRY